MEHIRSLDGVRGIAVLCVVFFHFFPRADAGVLVPLVSMGWAGVDLFFVLSGYLITRILYEHRGTIDHYRNFYGRRVLRLLPLYYFLFAGIAVLTPVLHIHWQPGHLVMLLQGSNLVLPRDNSLGNLGPFNLFHLWSLSVEEQFYLIWPWLIGSRLQRETLQRICAGGMIVAPALRLMLLHGRVNPYWIYQSLPTRMDSLLAGALLALIPQLSLRLTRIVAASSLLVLTCLIWRGHSFFFLSPSIQGVGYSALALLFASVIAMSLQPSTVVYQICSLAGAALLRQVQLWNLSMALPAFRAIREVEPVGATLCRNTLRCVRRERRADSFVFDNDRSPELQGDRTAISCIEETVPVQVRRRRRRHRASGLLQSGNSRAALSGSSLRKKHRGWKAMDTQGETPPCLDRIEHHLVPDVVLRRPLGGMSSPVNRKRWLPDVKGVQNQFGSAEMIRRTNHLSR